MNVESHNQYIEATIAVESIPSPTLLERMPALVRRERAAAAAVVARLVEIDRRKLYLDEACSSLYTYCTERLGYSEDEAMRRVRVARLVGQFPQVLDELRSGAIHLTGLFVLSRYVTPENVDALLAEARGKSRSQLQELIARWFPRPDVAPRLKPLAGGPGVGPATCAGTGTGAPYRLEPLAPSRYLVQFTASAELHQKLTQARELLSHVLPSGDLAALFERALDALLKREVRRRMGVGRPSRKHDGTSSEPAPAAAEPSNGGARAIPPTANEATARAESAEHTITESANAAPESTAATASAPTTTSRSRYVPRAVVRAVWERDGGQCTFLDGEGRRCQERRFMTLEHREPHALGGKATVSNLCLLCRGHNVHAGRRLFEERRRARSRDHARDAVETKIDERVLRGLCGLGFRERDARQALAEVRSEIDARSQGGNEDAPAVLRAAVLRLTGGASPSYVSSK